MIKRFLFILALITPIIWFVSCEKKEDILPVKPLIGIWEADSSQLDIQIIYNDSRKGEFSSRQFMGYNNLTFHNESEVTQTNGYMIFNLNYSISNDSIIMTDTNNYSAYKYTLFQNELKLNNRVNYIFSDSLGGGHSIYVYSITYQKK